MFSSVTLIKDFFGPVKKVALEELKALPKESRDELAQAIAKSRNLVPFPQANGTVQYGEAA